MQSRVHSSTSCTYMCMWGLGTVVFMERWSREDIVLNLAFAITFAPLVLVPSAVCLVSIIYSDSFHLSIPIQTTVLSWSKAFYLNYTQRPTFYEMWKFFRFKSSFWLQNTPLECYHIYFINLYVDKLSILYFRYKLNLEEWYLIWLAYIQTHCIVYINWIGNCGKWALLF